MVVSRVETREVTTMWQDKGADELERECTKKARRKALRISLYPRKKSANGSEKETSD